MSSSSRGIRTVLFNCWIPWNFHDPTIHYFKQFPTNPFHCTALLSPHCAARYPHSFYSQRNEVPSHRLQSIFPLRTCLTIRPRVGKGEEAFSVGMQLHSLSTEIHYLQRVGYSFKPWNLDSSRMINSEHRALQPIPSHFKQNFRS